eukprot:GFUD01007557.1.p1 GENE.GFUD01007557.1~~GFUD01007557.1.p1  ORF type:complete len:531 (+),score=169.32 GFUD01007557.1:298-1890(+)
MPFSHHFKENSSCSIVYNNSSYRSVILSLDSMSVRERRKLKLIQCRDGALDRRTINSIVKKVAGGGAVKRKHAENVSDSEKKAKLSKVSFVRGDGQYVYDEEGRQFLDCAASVSHVGHSHPHVIRAFCESQATALQWAGENVDQRNVKQREAFLTKFRSLLPASLSEVILVNSGSSANGLAIQICQAATGRQDVVVFDHTFHGSLSVSSSCSPMTFNKEGNGTKKPWVHVLPVPDLYRGPYRENDPAAIMKYFSEAKGMLEDLEAKGVKIACILMEPIFTFQGMTLAEPVYMQELVKYIHQLGALVIVDEVQGGLGRMGTTWGHEHLGINPDILTCGKPLSNGYPFAVVATSPRLVNPMRVITDLIQKECINPGPSLAVLEVIEREQMVSHVVRVGHKLIRQLRELGQRRRYVGRITGKGFMVGIDLVEDKRTRKPAKELATWVIAKMKAHQILLAVEGQYGNVVYLMPPLCFTRENAEQLVQALETVLIEAEMLGLHGLGEVHSSDEEKYFKTGDTDDEEDSNQYEDMD